MKSGSKKVAVSEFKAKALAYIAETSKNGACWTILKNGTPVAQVVPMNTENLPTCGMYKDQIQILSDLTAHDDSEDWDALK